MHPALEKLASIEKAATKGPWQECGTSIVPLDESQGSSYDTPPSWVEWISNGNYPRRDADADFIIAARNALPALIAAFAEIQREAANLGQLPEGYIEDIIHKHLESLK